jgi:acyl-coenzyme A synthetase/AMP-(fatty) acid ligase
VEEYAKGTLFHIVDRVKELIKVKGMQVAPAELESLLLEREDVADAAVVGVVIDGEELPRAYVVKTPNGKNTSEQDIANWLASRVVKYKQLRGGVVFVDTIPKVPVSYFSLPSGPETIHLRNLRITFTSQARF